MGLAGTKLGAGAELDPAGEIAEVSGHRSGSFSRKVWLSLFRELSVCGAVEDQWL